MSSPKFVDECFDRGQTYPALCNRSSLIITAFYQVVCSPRSS
jgi:hypothetical protein